MKIIVNEHQYSIIKEFIDEAKKKYPERLQEKMGDFLDEILQKTEVGSILVFSVGSATFSLECILANKPKYSFKVIEDKHNILNRQKVINLNLKDGNSPLEVYQKNSNKVTYNSVTNTYGLLIPNLKKEIFNIKDIQFLAKQEPQQQEPQQQEPQQQEPQPEEKTSGDTEQSSISGNTIQPNFKINKEKAKAAYDRILNDPNLKKAFYKQPSFWQMFTAELKGEKAAGSGIIRALDILDKYDLRTYNEEISKMFIVGENVTIQFFDDVTIPFDKSNSLNFNKNTNYLFVVGREKENIKTKLMYKKDKKYYLLIDKKLTDKSDESGDVFTTKINGVNHEIKILTDGYKSPGYNPEEE